jgi:hypothetical protein
MDFSISAQERLEGHRREADAREALSQEREALRGPLAAQIQVLMLPDRCCRDMDMHGAFTALPCCQQGCKCVTEVGCRPSRPCIVMPSSRAAHDN